MHYRAGSAYCSRVFGGRRGAGERRRGPAGRGAGARARSEDQRSAPRRWNAAAPPARSPAAAGRRTPRYCSSHLLRLLLPSLPCFSSCGGAGDGCILPVAGCGFRSLLRSLRPRPLSFSPHPRALTPHGHLLQTDALFQRRTRSPTLQPLALLLTILHSQLPPTSAPTPAAALAHGGGSTTPGGRWSQAWEEEWEDVGRGVGVSPGEEWDGVGRGNGGENGASSTGAPPWGGGKRR